MEIAVILYTLRAVVKTEQNFVRGEFPVRIRIAQLKEKAFIPLGYSSAPENWDKDKGLPKPSHPHYLALSKRISEYLEDLNFEIKSAEKSGHYLTCNELKRRAIQYGNTLQPKANQLKILEYFDKVINDLELAGRSGYADTFKNARATVSKLLNDGKHIRPADRANEKDKAFLAFTKEDHLQYERQITANDLSESTISHYLRGYYRIWNMAIKEGYCSREQHHPARYIGYQPYKRIRTKKRSINQDFLQDILNLQFDPDTRMSRSQMLLKFTYFGRGINFVDLCKLKWDNIGNGTLHYRRSKNRRQYDYTLHAEALKVVEYFRNHPQTDDSEYIFPFLTAEHDTPRKRDVRIDSALKDFNEDLKVMAQAVGWERKFTSYSLRHGFATHLRNNKVEISIIKEALGHETELQTSVYLDDLDDTIVAAAINKALDFKKPKQVLRKAKRKGPRP